jgi:DNA repair photolyase
MNNLFEQLKEYKKTNPKVLEPFHQFGLGCPLRLRVNVYKGCAYQCRFCYVRNKEDEPRIFSRNIGKYLEKLEKDIKKAKELGLNNLSVMVSCSTEPFQPLEITHRHTREVLGLLADEGFSLVIMTQNPSMLLEDEYLKIIKKTTSVVEVTIPSLTTEGIFQTGAPSPEERFKSLQGLVTEGIPVRLRLDPIVPSCKGSIQNEDEIEEIIKRFAEIFNKASDEIKKDMMVIANVMVLNNDVLEKLKGLDATLASKYQCFYKKNGYEYEREDGIKMLVLNREIQEKLLLPVINICREKEVPLCTCVLDVHFYKTRDCEFPIKNIPLSLDKSVTEEDIIKEIKEKFPAHPITEYEKRSFWTVQRFLVEDLEFLTFLCRKIFTSREFRQAVRERKIGEFLNNKNFIEEVLKELLKIDTNKLDFYYSYPVLYWIFAPLMRMVNACSTDKHKPDVIWGSLNFWDCLTESHYGTQFLQPDYFKPGDKFLFNKIINEWLLLPNNPYILTITKLFLTHKTNRKVIVIQKVNEKEEPPTYKKLYGQKILIRIKLSDKYTDILKKLELEKKRHKFKNKISQEKEGMDNIMKEYLDLIKNTDKSLYSDLIVDVKKELKNSELQIEINDAEIGKFLNLLFVFDLVSPEEWKWIVIYPSLIYTEEPIGGAFLVLNRLLDVPVDRIFQHMLTEIFSVPQILIDKEKILEQSLRSAVAAIMARNMSHNIGSHALWHISQEYPTGQEGKIKSFMNYIRERMGFVGLISTTKPTWAIEKNLEKDILKRFKNEEILCDNIVKSETEKKFEITFSECNKKIEMPHGLYGAQAFFVILENIIRNTVKHNIEKIKQSSSSLTFHIKLEEVDEEKYKDDYYKITVTDNLQTANENLITNLNKMIKDDIIDTTGKLNNRYLGFKEMKISAGFLLMLSPENLESENVPQPILKVDKINGNLSHIFYLRKPKEVLILSNKEIKNNEVLKNRGIFVVNEEAFPTIMEKKLTHKIFIIDLLSLNQKELVLTFIKNNILRFPLRIFLIDNEAKNKGENEIPLLSEKDFNELLDDPDKGIADIWQKWVGNWFSDRKEKEVWIIIGGKIKKIKVSDFSQKEDNLDQKEDNLNPNGNIVLTHDIIIKKKKNIYENSYYIDGFKTGQGYLDSMIVEIINNNKEVFYRLVESLLMKIVVVDERIWRQKDKKICPQPSDKWDKNAEFTLKEIWEKKQVYLVDHDTFINDPQKFVEELEKYKPDILIIHQGVIDKRVDKVGEEQKANKGDAKKEVMKFWLENILPKVKRVVIDSDRGKPAEISEEKGIWLDFADLNSIIIGEAENNLSKYLLVNLITSLREE